MSFFFFSELEEMGDTFNKGKIRNLDKEFC